MKSMTLLAILACFLLSAMSVSAQPTVAFAEGEIGFDYSRPGIGGYSGTFHALGPAGGAGEFISPEETEGCGGFNGNTPDVHFFMAIGAVRNPDSSQDIVVMVIYSDTAGITTGSYPVDFADFNSIFMYLVDVTEFEYPEDTTELDWTAILGSVVATHKFVSYSGVITINDIDNTTCNGTFSGSLFDIDDRIFAISVVDGEFALSGGIVSADKASFSELKSMFR